VVSDVSRELGDVLRRARRRRGLTLREVGMLSRGAFKPSALGGYERGERSISVERFLDLAEIYSVPADQLLVELLASRDRVDRRELVIDLTRLGMVEDPTRAQVAQFIHDVRTRREDYVTEVVTLRSGDLHRIALANGSKPHALLERLRPALRQTAIGAKKQPSARQT